MRTPAPGERVSACANFFPPSLPKPESGDDVAGIRSAASQLGFEGKQIVAILHSYREIAGTEALQGYGSAVLGLVYTTTMFQKKGDSFEAHLEPVGDFAWKSARDAFNAVSHFVPQVNLTVSPEGPKADETCPHRIA